MSDQLPLRQALDLLEEASSYTSGEAWSPSLTDEINSFVVNTRAALAAAPVQAVPDGFKLLEDGKTIIPSDWTWCRMEWEPGYPEDVAFGPVRMMERLKKWLDRYYAGMQSNGGWGVPDARSTWQGGLTNEELEHWWRIKLPNVEATNRDIGVFALGVEVGAGQRPAPKPQAVLDQLAAAPAAPQAPSDPDTWSVYVAGMIGGYLGWGVDDERIQTVAGIIDRRRWAAPQVPADEARRQAQAEAAKLKGDILKIATAITNAGFTLIQTEHGYQVRKFGPAVAQTAAPGAPQPAEPAPLTVPQILEMMPDKVPASYDGQLIEFARAIEAAHGIGAAGVKEQT